MRLLTHLFWFVLWLVVVVSKSPVSPLAPREELAVLQDARTVGGATCYVHHLLTFQGFHQVGGVHITVCSVCVCVCMHVCSVCVCVCACVQCACVCMYVCMCVCGGGRKQSIQSVHTLRDSL